MHNPRICVSVKRSIGSCVGAEIQDLKTWWSLRLHDDIADLSDHWKRLSIRIEWPSTRGNARSPVDSSHKGPTKRRFDVFFCVNLLNKRSNWRWCETPWRSCDITVIIYFAAQGSCWRAEGWSVLYPGVLWRSQHILLWYCRLHGSLLTEYPHADHRPPQHALHKLWWRHRATWRLQGRRE